jgi:ParB family chromosome partitioning protein
MNVKLPSVEDLFTAGASSYETAPEGQVQLIPISELHPFPNHPFLVKDDAKMEETIESIRNKGVLVPILVRTRAGGGYELISGHRRTHACRKLGLKTIPALIREMDDDEATIVMVDANIQRETLLPSEKAKAYAMKFAAMKHQGQGGGYTVAAMEKEGTDNARTIQRYISLSKLNDDLLRMIDKGTLGLSQGYTLATLDADEQKWLYDTLRGTEKRLSTSQAESILRQSRNGQLTQEGLEEMLNITPQPKRRIVLTENTLRRYFADNVDPQYMEQIILELLRQWKEQSHE